MRSARVALTVVALAIAASGCGQADLSQTRSTSGGTRAPATHSRIPAPTVGTDLDTALPVRWESPVITPDGPGGFQARLAPVSSSGGQRPVTVRLAGIGFPGGGEQSGRTYVGPGVDQHFTLQNNQFDVSFDFSGVRLGLLVFSTGGQWRVKVDGQYVGGQSPRSAGSSYAYHALDLDFSKAGGARRRTIEFQLSGGAWLAGLYAGLPSDRVSLPARPRAAAPSVYWLGDSYAVGSGAAFPGFDDLVHVASDTAGLNDVTVDALGGTGYVKTNPAARFPNYLQRARMNLRSGRAQPNLVVVGGSINDEGYSQQQVGAAAGALYAYIGRALPKAKIVVVPFTSFYPVPTPIQSAISGVLQAARAAPNVVGTLDLPAETLAQRGAVSVPRLSARLASTTVEFHPSPAGHLLYGREIGDFILRLLKEGRLR